MLMVLFNTLVSVVKVQWSSTSNKTSNRHHPGQDVKKKGRDLPGRDSQIRK